MTLEDLQDIDLTPMAPRSSLGDEVYEKLLALLISLKIAPGSRISVDATARRLGVSQTPVRNALIRLQAQGLVASAHNLGYSAAPLPSADQFAQIYDFRLMVEPHMARRAAEQMTSDDEEALSRLACAMEELRHEPEENAEYGQFALLDSEFHRWISVKAGNQVVVEALDRLHVHTQLFRLRYHSTVTSEAIKEHRTIVNAILARDGIAASAAMADHIRSSRIRLEPSFKRL